VHVVRLEWLGEGLAACSGETIAAHWVEVLAVKDSASRNLDAAHGNLVAAFGMEDVVHALVVEPRSGF
jgi:hypothetical protein